MDEKESQMRNCQFKGIRSSSTIVAEPFSNKKIRLIIVIHCNQRENLSQNEIEKRKKKNSKMILLNDLFDNKNELFLLFSFPNINLIIPNKEFNEYIQLNSSKEIKDSIPSGLIIRIRDYSEEMFKQIYQSMMKYSNKQSISSVCLLNESGITCGGSIIELDENAHSLFEQIYQFGLEFKGLSLKLDFIRTNPLTIEEYFNQTKRYSIQHYKKFFKKYLYQKFSFNEQIEDETSSTVEEEEEEEMNNFFRLEISRPNTFGFVKRKLVGSHHLFRLIPNSENVDINDYLPDILEAYSGRSDHFLVRMKSYFFSRLFVEKLRNVYLSYWDDYGIFPSELFPSIINFHCENESYRYNILIQGNSLILINYNPLLNFKLIHFFLSKHIIISNYANDIRFAGEIWIERQLDHSIVHLNNNSGTYQPNDQQLNGAAQFISHLFPQLKIQIHSYQNFF